MSNQQIETIPIKQYLDSKGVKYADKGKELICDCLFCQKKQKLYFNTDTGQYNCFSCEAKGNIFTLAEHFGDEKREVMLNSPPPNKKRQPRFSGKLVEQCNQNLPDNTRKYLNNRGITDEMITEYQIGYGEFYNQNWITIPIKNQDGKYSFFKLRQDPDNPHNGSKYKIFPAKGSEATIFGWELLKNNTDFILLCEGEFDAIMARSQGIPAISSTGGAKTFKQDWLPHFANLKNVYIAFDKDQTGEDGFNRVSEMLANKHEEMKIFKVTLPDELGEKADITDYFIKANGSVDDLFGKYSTAILNPQQAGRIAQVPLPSQIIDFNEFLQTIKTNFSELAFAAEMAMSIAAQILILDITNPFALVLIDVPSAGKTICVNFFDQITELTYSTDKFSPASFVSNAANVAKEDLEEIDLLPKIRYKMFLLRDLATLFSKRDDDLTEVMGLLTRVLDGEGLNTDSGVHGQRQYVGEYLFMMLAASTPIPPKVWKIMGNLGSRLFFLSLNAKEKDEEELVSQLTSTAYKDKEKQCRLTTKNFLYTLWRKYPNGVTWPKNNEDKECLLIISRCAKLLANLRGVINVWKERYEDGQEYSYTPPLIEQPNRLNQLFYNLCRGHALICGRDQVSKDDLRLIIELAIDSSPTTRAKLFRSLLENDGELSTGMVEILLKCSKPTALKEMEKLKILEVCYFTEDYSEPNPQGGNREKILKLSDKFKWFLSDECKQIRGIPLPPKQAQLSSTGQ